MNRTVFDYFKAHDRTTMNCFRLAGATGIVRYLVNDPYNDPRACTRQEVADAHGLGLSVHFFFEMNPTYASYFTFKQGQFDARMALAHLRLLGAPNDQVVYFTVDAPPSKVPVIVLDPYFNGIEDVQRNEDNGLIVPGLYGFEDHVEYARTRFPNVGKHLAQTYGTPNGPLDLWQHDQDAICGVAVDINDCTVDGWKEKDMTDDDLNAWYEKNIAPKLEVEIQQRKKEAIDEAVDRSSAIAAAADEAAANTAANQLAAAMFFRDLPIGADYDGTEENPLRFAFKYPDGSTHVFDAHSGVEITS